MRFLFICIFVWTGKMLLGTTNGDWTQGDGIVLGEAVGARLEDMNRIQVYVYYMTAVGGLFVLFCRCF